MEIIRAGNTALWAGSLKTRPNALKKLLGKRCLMLPSFESSLSAAVVTGLFSPGTDPTEASLVVKHPVLCKKEFTEAPMGKATRARAFP